MCLETVLQDLVKREERQARVATSRPFLISLTAHVE